MFFLRSPIVPLNLLLVESKWWCRMFRTSMFPLIKIVSMNRCQSFQPKIQSVYVFSDWTITAFNSKSICMWKCSECLCFLLLEFRFTFEIQCKLHVKLFRVSVFSLDEDSLYCEIRCWFRILNVQSVCVFSDYEFARSNLFEIRCEMAHKIARNVCLNPTCSKFDAKLRTELFEMFVFSSLKIHLLKIRC